MYKITLTDKEGVTLRVVTKENTLAAEDVYNQFINFHSVRAGYNNVRLEEK